MQEYLSDAIVLKSDPSGALDLRISLFTKKFGKIVGKVKSARKITSKLCGHLQPGFLIKARIIEKNGPQIVDALKIKKLNIGTEDLSLINRLTGEMEPDQHLWASILSERVSWRQILEILGWNPASASCSSCGKEKPTVFNIPRQDLFCVQCASKERLDAVIYI